MIMVIMLVERADRRTHSLRDVFLEDVYAIPGGERIKECIQCGTCSASCPTSYAMDYTPWISSQIEESSKNNPITSIATAWLL
jgi:heterodisulfide reductase subunit C